IQNSAIIDGNGSAIFQGIHNSPINISLALSDPQVLATLAQQILQQSQSPKLPHHIGDQWQPNTIFFGRSQDMETITEQLRTSKALLLLNGIGGMGKTALANELRYQIGDQYDHVIWTNLQNAADTDEQPLRNHLLYNSIQLHQDLGITEVLRSEQDETQKWAILVRALRQLGSNVLWIIDNAHQQDQSAIKALPDNCHILLTSRHAIGDISTHYVDELNPNDALDLFKHYYKRPDDDQSILDVCGAVGYHALSVELLAKTLNELPNKDASFLLQELKSRGININRQQQIWTNYAQRETYLNECLLAAFDLGKLREQTHLHGLLRFFCLMPYQDVAYAVVQQLTQTIGDTAEDELLRHLQQLSKLGWLKPNQINWFGTTQKSWKMHTVIQDVVQQQLGRDESLEDGVAEVLRNEAFKHYEKHPIEAQEWRSFLETMVKKVDREIMPIAWCCDILGHLLSTMGHHDKALLNNQKALDIGEQILPAQHPDLASLYMNIASTYDRLTQYDSALAYYERCQAIYEKILPAQHPNLATLYMNMAALYQSLTQYDTALAYCERCRAIFEQILPAQHPNLASLYMNMGITYDSLNQYDTALAYYERCRAIREQILPAQHPDLALLYMNMAALYQSLTQYDTALAYCERCRAIWEQILPAQHPDLALLYMNMANTYQRLTQYDTALAYYERCRAIREQMLPTQHPDLASLYMNMASAYLGLTQYDTALAYYERCRAIREQILPAQHPDLAILDYNIAELYGDQFQFLEAKAYIDKAVTIFQQTLPPEHPYLQYALELQQQIHQNLPPQ
ncbi:MAG: ATP-binding protein, partial [Chitinophagales bacterium]|nr:ATP-binding protein [Chitinophagales bacterium]